MNNIVTIVLNLAVAGATAHTANKKGYNPIVWFFGGGLLGLIILSILPDTHKDKFTEEAKKTRRIIGNSIGGVLAALSLFLIVFFLTA